MKDPKCPHCGAAVSNIICHNDNGCAYGCPRCGAAVAPSRQPCKVLPYGCETVGHGGEITDVRFTDDGHTVLHVRLDGSEHSFKHWRVRIIECEEE